MTPDNICAYGGLVSPQFKIKWLIKIHFTDAGDAEADVLFGMKTQRHLGIPHLCFDLKKNWVKILTRVGIFKAVHNDVIIYAIKRSGQK